MSSAFGPEELDALKDFIEMLKLNPAMIHADGLDFFRAYLVSLGATLPAKPEKKDAPAKEEKMETEEATSEPAPAPEPESEESDVELDMEGVIGKALDIFVMSMSVIAS